MKFLKKCAVALFWLLIVALMILPLGILYQISLDEMAAYQTPEAPKLVEVAVGGLARAYRTDVAEFVTVSGVYTSKSYAYMELDPKKAGTIRWIVDSGDEIQEGQIMGTWNGQEILSEVTGVLVERNTYASKPYLRFRTFEPLVLSCRVSNRTLTVLKHSGSLTTQDGYTVTLEKASMIENADGTVDILLSVDGGRQVYGQHVEDLRLLTGMVYRNVVVLPQDCVYQKTPGEDEPWYARWVTESGVFIAEVEVKIGYSSGDLVCVTGVEEGDWFDTGYKTVVGG